jgi:hypothetical protein
MAARHGAMRLPDCWVHESRRHITRVTPPVPGLWLPYTHADCVCNELVSARNRVLGEVPLPTPRGLKAIARQRRKLLRGKSPLQPWTLERTRDSFTGSRKKRYCDAYESLSEKPLTRSDARISAFVKAEKADPSAKKNPDPRMIQARQPRYNLVLASYLRPVEHRIYNLCGWSGLRMVAKGLNAKQRATLLQEKWDRFESPVCVSLDASRFDKHVSRDVLYQEHLYYLNSLGNPAELKEILAMQMKNKCSTKNGVKYTVDGGRMSGDINTALGNCLIMIMMILASCDGLKLDAEVLDDGDDCLLIFERSHLNRVVAALPGIFLEYGQELKVENIAYNISDVVFCQSKVITTVEGPMFVRDWRKVLSHACTGTKYWDNPRMVRPMMGLVGMCELAMSRGVPVLQPFALAVIRNSQGKTAKTTTIDPGVVMRIKNELGSFDTAYERKSLPITDAARESFAETFGVEIWEQQAIEAILSDWVVNELNPTTYPVEIDHSWVHEVHVANVLPEIY